MINHRLLLASFLCLLLLCEAPATGEETRMLHGSSDVRTKRTSDQYLCVCPLCFSPIIPQAEAQEGQMLFNCFESLNSNYFDVLFIHFSHFEEF